MKPFKNETNNGNEQAIRRGRSVPEDAVNLAWVKSPQLSPAKNIVVVDTSRVVEENVIQAGGSKKVMYANHLGVLEDLTGNQLIEDEFPVISDTFTVDEDWSTTPGDEYRDWHVLPFVHRSRFFHVDFAGLVLNNDLIEYETEAIKVVDNKGREYVDDDGVPRYKIKITSAYAQPTDDSISQGAYRVYAYTDSEANEDLYLQYNKVEITAVSEDFKNHEINYREILNPVPYYDYVPEESEVVDPANRRKRIYSSKPISLKQQVLDEPIQGKEGYRIFVPKKALGDPRIFQLFRWRVSCSFTQKFKIDPNSGVGIRAGVIVTDAVPTSRAPYAFYNLAMSAYNATQIRFYNPLRDGVPGPTGSELLPNVASYWYVNLDTISFEDLKKFDILIWAPQTTSFDLNPYNNKIDYFVKTLGGTIFYDTSNYTYTTGLGVTVTRPVSATGVDLVSTGTAGYGNPNTFAVQAPTNSLFDADSQMGGWDFNDTANNNDEYRTLTGNALALGAKTHYVTTVPSDTTVLHKILATTGPSAGQQSSTILYKSFGKGNLIYSTLGILSSTSSLFSNSTSTLVNSNLGSTAAALDDYRLYVNSSVHEGAMKFLFNASLLAVKSRVLDDTDERAYSSSWTYATDWKSSWVISAGNGVLSDYEIQENDFVFLPKSLADATPVWQRKLLYGDKSKTMKELLDSVLTPDMLKRVQGSQRNYVIEVTNSKVQVPTVLGDNSYPFAWTEEYTPKFEVPVELGPHVVRSDDLKARFEAGQYTHRTYPAKPYSGQVRTVHFDTTEFNQVQVVNWTASGTATLTTTTGTYTPPSSTSYESDVALNCFDSNNRVTDWSGWQYEYGAYQPPRITTWQNWNYHNSAWGPGILNWPHFSVYGRYAQGSSGDVVAWIQDVLNLIVFLGGGHWGGVNVDGYYGPATASAVRAMQITFGARYVDGVVDAESLSLLGSQCLRYEYVIRQARPNDGGWHRFYYWVFDSIRRQYVSDGTPHNAYRKRSWHTGGPSIIWEMFQMEFDKAYNIHGVTFTPYVEGASQTVMFRSIDVRRAPHNLINYNSETGNPIYMPHRPVDGQPVYVPFYPRYGEVLIVGVGQDRGSGFGTSRMLGVRDITAHARVLTTVTTPGVNTINKQTKTIAVTASGIAYVTSRTDAVVTLSPSRKLAFNEAISNIQFISYQTDNANVTTSIQTLPGGGQALVLKSQLVNTQSGTSIITGPLLPGGTYYWMNDAGVRSGAPETGWISKTDGLKILCNADKSPYGIPALLPTNVGPNEAQRHYAKISLVGYGNDSTVQMGLWDNSRKEFIVNADGQPEMTYIEYLSRGPQNIYIAVISTYELDTQRALPPGDDSPPLPYKWAMPVYGLYKRHGSKIALEPLAPNLNSDDVWPIGIRVGKFSRRTRLRTATEGPINGCLSPYQGTEIQAFYSIPEADRSGWSSLYGPPNYDVKNEQPIILDDDVLQVRQAPIHMVEVPTTRPTMADPVRPVFTVWHRETRVDEWVALESSEIRDYNTSTGEIVLRTPMELSDPDLWKVDYTTSRRIYFFKEYNSTILNLNPYLSYSKQFIGKALYIYIVPQFVRDKDGRTIDCTVVSNTLRFTTDPGVFDSMHPAFDPLAIQLGVVYLSTALDIDDLTILDTRRRGGGAKDEMNASEIVRLVSEASNYWDISYGSGLSYQKGGFVIVRLPEELKASFTEAEIVDIIERNITAGVRFKIEDLSGRDWSDPT